jgi:para-aminobenzoate synthetase component 1
LAEAVFAGQPPGSTKADPTKNALGHLVSPPFAGGWIGWLSYDLGRLFEELPTTARNDLNLPLFEFTFHPSGTAFDGLTGRSFRFEIANPQDDGPIETVDHACERDRDFVSNFSAAEYERAVARAIEYIRAGDVFQVNLSQRFTGSVRTSAAAIYRRLALNSPAWFGAYYAGADYALVSNSPELFLDVSPDPSSGQRHIITRPIKGTRPNIAGMDRELRDSIKDQVELNMIVDLERNDLGRICQIGTVKVTEPRAIEEHPTVYHGAATIEGALRDDVTFIDLLRATFPGGSVTGAPKIRAMQIIEELEPVRRGPYCGAIGFLSVTGHIQFNLAIRTMVMKDGLIHVPVGGGIVADSDPAEEYRETLVKARAMFAALGVDYSPSC